MEKHSNQRPNIQNTPVGSTAVESTLEGVVNSLNCKVEECSLVVEVEVSKGTRVNKQA